MLFSCLPFRLVAAAPDTHSIHVNYISVVFITVKNRRPTVIGGEKKLLNDNHLHLQTTVRPTMPLQ